MNRTKLIFTALLTLSLIFSAFTLTACNENATESVSGSITVVVAGTKTESFTVSLDGLDTSRGFVAALDALKAEGKLDYGITDTFLDYVGEVKNNYEKGEYIYVYTSVEADQDVSVMRHSITYEGRELVSAGVGAAEMTLQDGAVIYVAPHTPKW